MSKKNKDILKDALETLFLEEDDFEAQENDHICLDAYDLEREAFDDETEAPSHRPDEESAEVDLSKYAEDISEEDFNYPMEIFCKDQPPRENGFDADFDVDLGDELWDVLQRVEQENPRCMAEQKHSEQKLSEPEQIKESNATPPKKDESKKNQLYAMEKALSNCVKLIRHDGGVYYFNGKCYAALRNDMDLLELVRRKVSTSAFSIGSVKCFQDLLTFLKTDPALIPNHYDRKLERAKGLVSLKNGVLDLNTLELLDFDEKYLVFHNIDAKWTNQYPHTFMRFLYDSCGDEEVVRLATEVIGYLLSGAIWAKKFFVVGPAKDSGKTTLAELVIKLLGEDLIISVEPNKLHERFALGSSRGRILGVSMDIPRGKLCPAAVSKIKAISGLDHTSLEQKYAPMEFTRSTLRFWFGTNYPVTISSSGESGDDAFWERLVVIPFTKSVDPSRKDVNLGARLWEERDAIVSLCLQNYRDVYARGFIFSHSRAAEDMKESWRRGTEASYQNFASFFSDFVEITENPKDGVFTNDLHDAYTHYCREKGVDFIYHTDMLHWIDKNYGSVIGERDRFRMGDPVPRWGYHGIKLHYEMN